MVGCGALYSGLGWLCCELGLGGVLYFRVMNCFFLGAEVSQSLKYKM